MYVGAGMGYTASFCLLLLRFNGTKKEPVEGQN